MTPTIYALSGAPNAWRALLGFAFKGVEYDVHYLQGSEREHKAPEFLDLNPRGKVPVLRTDGIVLRESIAILAWLDRTFPARPLFGDTADAAAAIWQAVMECDGYLQSATSGVVFPVFAGDGSAPAAGSAAADELSAAAEILDAELGVLETLLGDDAFLCGAEVSAADAVAYPEIGRVQRAIETKPAAMAALGYDRLDERYPRLAAWRARVAGLAGVDRTVPIHWRAGD